MDVKLGVNWVWIILQLVDLYELYENTNKPAMSPNGEEPQRTTT